LRRGWGNGGTEGLMPTLKLLKSKTRKKKRKKNHPTGPPRGTGREHEAKKKNCGDGQNPKHASTKLIKGGRALEGT